MPRSTTTARGANHTQQVSVAPWIWPSAVPRGVSEPPQRRTSIHAAEQPYAVSRMIRLLVSENRVRRSALRPSERKWPSSVVNNEILPVVARQQLYQEIAAVPTRKSRWGIDGQYRVKYSWAIYKCLKIPHGMDMESAPTTYTHSTMHTCCIEIVVWRWLRPAVERREQQRRGNL
jgi:hypothetical protein